MEDLGVQVPFGLLLSGELWNSYVIFTRNNVSKEQLPWHKAVGMGSLNRGFGDHPVLAYWDSFFSDFRQATTIFLPRLFACDRQEKWTFFLCAKCAKCFSRRQIRQESLPKYKDEGWETGEGSTKPHRWTLFFPREFPHDHRQGSLLWAPVFHLSCGHYRQYFLFFGVCNQD